MDKIIALENILLSMGASIVGYSNLEGKLEGNMTRLPYAITIGIRLSDFTIDEIKDKPTYTYFHHYKSVNTLIDSITLRAALFIEEIGYSTQCVPSSQTVNDKNDSFCGIFPHKTAAVMAGLGWIGKNALFISHDFGPRVRLGTILTNMKLPVGEANEVEAFCGECNKCVLSCPAMAFTGNTWQAGCERSDLMDARACSTYMNENFKHIGRGSVCGICIKVCPKGSKRKIK